MSNQGKSFYEVLGVPRNARSQEIKRKYDYLVKKVSDKQLRVKQGNKGGKSDYTSTQVPEKQLKEVEQAFRTLSDPTLRQKYDASIGMSKSAASIYPSVSPAPPRNPVPSFYPPTPKGQLNPLRWSRKGLVMSAVVIIAVVGLLLFAGRGTTPSNSNRSVFVVSTPTRSGSVGRVSRVTSDETTVPVVEPTEFPTVTHVPTERPTKQPTSAPSDESRCSVSLPSRLRIGELGRVTFGGLPNRVRLAPNSTGEYLGQINPGEVFQVIDGPRCSDRIAWWFVSYQTLQGWTAEGAGKEYFLEPYSGSVGGTGFVLPTNRRKAPANSQRLSGGSGLTNGERMTDGKFQVEGYCKELGKKASQNNSDWYCGSFSLTAKDFDIICQKTYGRVEVFAIQDGGTRVPAFNWRCYKFS